MTQCFARSRVCLCCFNIITCTAGRCLWNQCVCLHFWLATNNIFKHQTRSFHHIRATVTLKTCTMFPWNLENLHLATSWFVVSIRKCACIQWNILLPYNSVCRVCTILRLESHVNFQTHLRFFRRVLIERVMKGFVLLSLLPWVCVCK